MNKNVEFLDEYEIVGVHCTICRIFEKVSLTFSNIFSKRNFTFSHPTVNPFTATYRTTLYESKFEPLTIWQPRPPMKKIRNTHHSPLDPDSVFGLLGWQINAGKFSCRSTFKKSRQMLWCLYS